jgi:hypothetical protein
MEAGSVFTALYPPPLPPFDLKIRSIKDLGLDFGMAFSGVFGSAGVCRLGEWVDFGRGFAAELAVPWSAADARFVFTILYPSPRVFDLKYAR